MMPAEEIGTLAAGIVAVLGMLWRISYRTGQLVTRLDLHLKGSEESHRDYEARLRDLERAPAPSGRPRRSGA